MRPHTTIRGFEGRNRWRQNEVEGCGQDEMDQRERERDAFRRRRE